MTSSPGGPCFKHVVLQRRDWDSCGVSGVLAELGLREINHVANST